MGKRLTVVASTGLEDALLTFLSLAASVAPSPGQALRGEVAQGGFYCPMHGGHATRRDAGALRCTCPMPTYLMGTRWGLVYCRGSVPYRAINIVS